MHKIFQKCSVRLLAKAFFSLLMLLFFTNSSIAQSKEVNGIVKDEQGKALSGATVSVKGTKQATTTNEVGAFKIVVPKANSVLVISYVGYNDMEIYASDNNLSNLTLQVKVDKGNEVVVVGYGSQRKKDLTGSVTKVGADVIRSYPVVSADQALQGRAAGVQVFQSSGAPGGAVQVRIRGVNSTSGSGANQPLYVIDGIPVAFDEQRFGAVRGGPGFSSDNTGGSGAQESNGASPLSTINPNDIESIEVLKDASATAIYGSRAANGVVLITTKMGRTGKARIEFNTYYGVQSLRKKIPVVNGREYAYQFFEFRRNTSTLGGGNIDQLDAYVANPFLFPTGTDWQEEVFRDAIMANYNLGISGGTDRVNYNVTGDYQQQDGILINTNSNRASFRTNVDIRATNKLKVGTRTSMSYQWGNNALTDYSQGGLGLVTTLTPLMPVYDAFGNFAGSTNPFVRNDYFGDGRQNIVADLKSDVRETKRYRINANVFAEYKILPSLTFRTTYGIDYQTGQKRLFLPSWRRGTVGNVGNGININPDIYIEETRPQFINTIADQLLTYDKAFGSDHKLNAVLGFSVQNFTINELTGTGRVVNATSNTTNQLNPSLLGTSGYFRTDNGLVSQFFRANYSFKDRYLFTGTVRRDGSSRFGANNKYGYFPAASVGWRVSDEKFMKKFKFLDELKVRASYGIAGSQNIGDFSYLAQAVERPGNFTVFGDTYVPSINAASFDNPDIRWEQNKKLDLGVDLSILNRRLNLTVDYYINKTDGLLTNFNISTMSGVGNSVIKNIGVIENRGWEFALNVVPVETKNFRWSVDFNISTNKNTVLSLGSTSNIFGQNVSLIGSYINNTMVGHPIGAFYVLQTDGMYLSWEEANMRNKNPNYRYLIPQDQAPGVLHPGDLRIKDQDKNDTIDIRDRVWLGSPFPDFYGGVTTNFSYKNLSLSVVSSFQHGNLIWNQPRLRSEAFGITGVAGSMWQSSFDNRYQYINPNQATSVPIPRFGSPRYPSSNYFDDGSFFRIRSINLGYELPTAWLEKARIARLKLYVQANNFFVFTKYQGWDPEVNSFGSNVQTNGIDYGAYPQAKSIVFGLNLGL